MKLNVLLTLQLWLLMLAAPVQAENISPGLIGHWELIEQPYSMSIEFKENGIYIAFTPHGVMTGRWKSLDTMHLWTWNDEQMPKRITQYAIEDDILTITETNGDQLRHRRILLLEP